ncbi:MAG: hypothetical protein A2V93_05030 [Ignavibacteria bacterium RBG_16_34_14]|nr:MAG: hypothetical protein A2V93_05030 [Ignavibacteria bacterium RBG_16_34_14]
MDQIKKFSPAIFAIIIFCFFLPFVNLTCSGQTVMTMTGIQLITGAEYKPQGMLDQQGMFENQSGQQSGQPTTDQSIDSQPMALFALVAAVLALALSFVRKKLIAIICMIASVFGAVCLLLLKGSLDSDASMQGQGVVQIEYQFGFWFSFLLFVIGAVLQWVIFKEKPQSANIVPEPPPAVQ